MRYAIAIIVALFGLITYYSTSTDNQVTGEKQHVKLTASQEVALGRQLAPQMAAREAFRTLVESGEEQLPVIDDNALQGILRRRDMIRYIQIRLARHSA